MTFVENGLIAACSSRYALRTRAPETALLVDTGAAVETRVKVTLVPVLLAPPAPPPATTHTLHPAPSRRPPPDAQAEVLTRLVAAFVLLLRADLAFPRSFARAVEPSGVVVALASVLTRVRTLVAFVHVHLTSRSRPLWATGTGEGTGHVLARASVETGVV